MTMTTGNEEQHYDQYDNASLLLNQARSQHTQLCGGEDQLDIEQFAAAVADVFGECEIEYLRQAVDAARTERLRHAAHKANSLAAERQVVINAQADAIDRLKRERHDLRENECDRRQVRKMLKEATKENKQLQKSLREAQDRERKAVDSLADEEASGGDSMRFLQNAREQRDDAISERDAALRQLKEAHAKIADQQNENSELHRQVDTLDKMNEECLEEIERLRTQTIGQFSKLDELNCTLEDEEAAAQDTLTAWQRVKEQRDAAIRQCKQVARRNEELSERLRLQSHPLAEDREIERLKREAEDYRQIAVATSGVTQRQAKEIQRYVNEIDRLKESAERMAQTIKELERECECRENGDDESVSNKANHHLLLGMENDGERFADHVQSICECFSDEAMIELLPMFVGRCQPLTRLILDNVRYRNTPTGQDGDVIRHGFEVKTAKPDENLFIPFREFAAAFVNQGGTLSWAQLPGNDGPVPIMLRHDPATAPTVRTRPCTRCDERGTVLSVRSTSGRAICDKCGGTRVIVYTVNPGEEDEHEDGAPVDNSADD